MTTERFQLRIDGWPEAGAHFPDGQQCARPDSFECQLQFAPTTHTHSQMTPGAPRSNLPRRLVLRTLAAGWMAMASLSFAQSSDPFELSWFAVAGGGGPSSGGPFSMSGTLGQPGVGPLSGGDYSVTAGFWAIMRTIQEPGAPRLRITRAGPEVILAWPNPSTGFELEQASALPGLSAQWTPVDQLPTVVNGEKQVRLSGVIGDRFFRLRKP